MPFAAGKLEGERRLVFWVQHVSTVPDQRPKQLDSPSIEQGRCLFTSMHARQSEQVPK